MVADGDCFVPPPTQINIVSEYCDAQAMADQGHKQPANDVRGDGSFRRYPS
jgi:hypothetical protein